MEKDLTSKIFENIFGYSSHIISNLPNENEIEIYLSARNGANFAVVGDFKLQVKPKYLINKVQKIDEIGIHHQGEFLDYSYAQIRPSFLVSPLNLRISNHYFNSSIDSNEFRNGGNIQIINPFICYNKKIHEFILIGGKQKDIGKFDYYFKKFEDFLGINSENFVLALKKI